MRSRFRSQPTLDRGSHGTPLWTSGVGVVAAAGVAFAVVSSIEQRLPPPVAEESATLSAAQVAEAHPYIVTASATPAAAVAGPALRPAIEPQGVVAAQSRPKVQLRGLASAVPARSAAPRQLAQAPADRANLPNSYAVARAAYDQRERVEGYQWARRYKVAMPSYCRVAQQRTPSFMAGCLDYFHS